MNFFLVSIERVTSHNPQLVYVKIASYMESNDGSVEVTAKVEFVGDEIMDKSLSAIEKMAIDKFKATRAA